LFDKILIANRGEIARRIIRSCRDLGILAVAVYSEADLRAPFVEEADEAVFIGGAPARESYLRVDAIINAALTKGCAAIHPGYGFLSENAMFAQGVRDAGLVFIGPSPEAIATLGDKMAAKALAVKAGVPVVPGHSEALADEEEALAAARTVGFPVLLKPAAGGGGRGMRIVYSEDQFASAILSCREETRKSFGDDRIFLERYIEEPRHIEVQILADEHGNIVHLGERECSIQRRYQKVIEETPSTAVDEGLRAEMGRVAVALAKEAGYTSAGTVEFVLAPNKRFYFLEMNTRLQVEHPVTEMVTGLDLVEMQIRIAAGEPLGLRQEDLRFNGWAIEARLCAEDPSRGFLPTTGMITRYAMPRGKNIRVDSGIGPGSVITIYYDSLLAKIVAWGKDREEARLSLIRALNGYHIEGLVTNVDFANAIVSHEGFARGQLSTHFIEENFEEGEPKLSPNPEHMGYMVIAAVLVYHTRQSLVRESLKPMMPHVGSAPVANEVHSYVVRTEEERFQVQLEGHPASRLWEITVNGVNHEVITPEFEYYRRRLVLKINGQSHMFRLQYVENHIRAFFCGIVKEVEVYSPREWRLASYMLKERKPVQENVLRCPMPGLITSVSARQGEYVRRGQELLRMESMKMESAVASPCDGIIERVLAEPGKAAETDEVLIVFKI